MLCHELVVRSDLKFQTLYREGLRGQDNFVARMPNFVEWILLYLFDQNLYKSNVREKQRDHKTKHATTKSMHPRPLALVSFNLFAIVSLV